MPQQFAHISDPHLTDLSAARFSDMLNKRLLGYISWRRKRRFEHRIEVLDALRSDLEETELAQLLVTGDLTHIGLPDEFQQAREWLEALGSGRDIAVVPGNHDACVATPANETFDLWQQYMSGDSDRQGFPSQRVRGDICFIGLNTGCPKPPLMATGTLGQQQLERLPALLDEARRAGKFRVVYLHHCPLPGKEKWRKRLTDADRMRDILQQHGAELVLHGHGHRAHAHTLSGQWGSAPVIAVPSASALGMHGADSAAYNRYEVAASPGGWTLTIEPRVHSEGKGFVAGPSRQIDIRRPWQQPFPASL